MKQSIILKEEYYLSATERGLEINPIHKNEVIMFLRGLKGLQYSFTSSRENHDQLFVSFRNGVITPHEETDEGWSYLTLEWEDEVVNLKLYRVIINYGECVIAAASDEKALDIILQNSSLKRNFSNLKGECLPRFEILKFVTPIEGYEIKGKPGVISYYQEYIQFNHYYVTKWFGDSERRVNFFINK